VTYVKYGQQVDSPIVDIGEADLILAFEQLEAARWLPYLKPDGRMIVNTQRIDPMPVITGAAEYPEGLLEALRAKASVQTIDALALALEAGSARAVNVVLLGALARQMDLPLEVWQEAIRNTVKPQFVELNLKAFCSLWRS
jgi:indolepyruvate ferredoxin oxidoreductase beta subunit